MRYDADCRYCAGKSLEWTERIKLFTREVVDHKQDIDPQDELDWYALSIGWAIAQGMAPTQAVHFALHLRYHTDIG